MRTPAQEIYRKTEPQDLRGPILLAALALFLLDTLIVLWLGGGLARLLPRLTRAGTTAALLLAALAFTLLRRAAAPMRRPRTRRARRWKPSLPMCSPAIAMWIRSARPGSAA